MGQYIYPAIAADGTAFYPIPFATATGFFYCLSFASDSFSKYILHTGHWFVIHFVPFAMHGTIIFSGCVRHSILSSAC
jgi:hypothetical protein